MQGFTPWFTDEMLYRKGATSTITAMAALDADGKLHTETHEVKYENCKTYPDDFPFVARAPVTQREWREFWESRGKKVVPLDKHFGEERWGVKDA